MFVGRAFILSALAFTVNAHFQLAYPPTRGFDEDKEPQAPCGGFNSVTTRTPFPLGDGYIKLSSEHESATVTVLISFVENPTDIKNFTLTSTGSPLAALRPFFAIDGDDICIQTNVQSVGYQGVGNGTNATILVQYAGGDGDLFQCTDVTLSSTATIPSSVTCKNEYTTGAQTGTGTVTASPSPTTAAASRVMIDLRFLSVLGFMLLYLL